MIVSGGASCRHRTVKHSLRRRDANKPPSVIPTPEGGAPRNQRAKTSSERAKVFNSMALPLGSVKNIVR